MIIENLMIGKYLARPNRFTVEFKNEEGKVELAHLHDPGRLKELLIENTDILIKFVSTYKKTGRKTKYDLIAVKYLGEWVLLNSSYHNKLVEEFIQKKTIEKLEEYHVHKAEHTFGESRIDFLLKNYEDENMLLEVKGCTLVVEGHALFPDAPTKRGKRHVDELIKARKNNIKSSIVILVLQNYANIFSPNYDTDPEFSLSLKEAYDSDVTVLPVHVISKFKNNSLELFYDKELPVQFHEK